jgi:hypothetical protein
VWQGREGARGEVFYNGDDDVGRQASGDWLMMGDLCRGERKRRRGEEEKKNKGRDKSVGSRLVLYLFNAVESRL